MACGLQLDEGQSAELAPPATPAPIPTEPVAANEPLPAVGTGRPWEVITAVVLSYIAGALWLVFIAIVLLAASSGSADVTWTDLIVMLLIGLVLLVLPGLVLAGFAWARWALSGVLAVQAVATCVVAREVGAVACLGAVAPVLLLFTPRAKAFCHR